VSLLVDPADLRARLDSVQLVDTRPAEQFAAGRIPGAIHLELWALSLNDTDPEPLGAFLWTISHYLTTRGIDPKRPVVVYEDSESGIRAARAFWFLEYFGHPDVMVLDGGFKAWTSAGLPVETGAGQTPPKGTWPDDGSTQRREEALAGWRHVFAGAGAPAHRTDLAILDARSEDEYRGRVRRAKRAGAIPNAINVEWKENLDASGRFKPAAELRKMYEAKGITPDREVITYCQGGYRSAQSYLALRLSGFPRVRNYIASWGEWGDREDLPIENPGGEGDKARGPKP
jgi:thiosulfate/3-mercaptopyruvate sulfurtransferase